MNHTKMKNRRSLMYWLGLSLQPTGFIFVMMLILSATLSSCVTNHCNESIYAPLNIRFNSEVDTSKNVVPEFFSLQGVGADSILYAQNNSSMNVNLKTGEEETQYIATMVYPASQKLELKADSTQPFIQTRMYDRDNKSMLFTIPSSYHLATDSSVMYQVENYNEYFFTFKGETWVYMSHTEGVHIFAKPLCDTFIVTHNNQPVFVSAECGVMHTHEIKEAYFLNNKVGSVIIENPQINDQSYERHIKFLLENYD